MQMLKVHVFISGLVQGVSYRAWTQKIAQSLALSGWVKNLVDGRVEAVFVGEKNKIEKMIEFLYQGSSVSQIEKVEVVEKEKIQTDPFRGEFLIKR
ncbi:acylphosphatase [Candidatus Microgenomates bacterium]|nr:acylphosphatase [Candidatus Microgenomates bacterium]